jgi:type IV secretory pathway TrbL component
LVRLALVFLALERWPWLLGGLRDIAITFGLLATGNLVDVANFLDPGGFLRLGLQSGAVLWKAFQNNLGWTSFVTGLAYLLAWVAYGAAFAVMAYKVFWWQVELLIASLGGLCLLPTLMFRPTAFVAAGVLSYAANTFARFLLGALLAGALWKHLGKPRGRHTRGGGGPARAGHPDPDRLRGGGPGLGAGRLLSGPQPAGRHAHQWHSRHGRGQ